MIFDRRGKRDVPAGRATAAGGVGDAVAPRDSRLAGTEDTAAGNGTASRVDLVLDGELRVWRLASGVRATV